MMPLYQHVKPSRKNIPQILVPSTFVPIQQLVQRIHKTVVQQPVQGISETPVQQPIQ